MSKPKKRWADFDGLLPEEVLGLGVFRPVEVTYVLIQLCPGGFFPLRASLMRLNSLARQEHEEGGTTPVIRQPWRLPPRR